MASVMRPVIQDDLEPKGRWTQSITFWHDGTMQLITQSGVEPGYYMDIHTMGSISDETIRRHTQKMEACGTVLS
jgi:hypothetical protein